MAKIEREVKLNYCTMQLSEKCKNKSGMLPLSEFYTANSLFYINGKYNICKNCLKSYVYEKDGSINTNKLKTIFRIYDIPFFQIEWLSALNDEKETIGVYFKNLYLNHKNQVWLNGDFQENDNVKDDQFVIEEELTVRWGEGWTVDDMKWLEKNYTEWLTHHDCDKLSTKKLVRMICVQELEIRKARECGQPTDKLVKSLLELMNNSNLTPKTMNATSETDSSKAFGVWLKDIEKTRPAEFFQDKNIYKDYDNILDYWNRFVLRPMKNLLCGTREFDKEFQPIEFDDYIDEES